MAPIRRSATRRDERFRVHLHAVHGGSVSEHGADEGQINRERSRPRPGFYPLATIGDQTFAGDVGDGLVAELDREPLETPSLDRRRGLP